MDRAVYERLDMKQIYVLIVTYNRLEKLKKCLAAYDEQTFLPHKIIIVDNCSTDGTKDFLNNWERISNDYGKKVIYLDKNYGGSGGFYEGMKAAQEENFDWLWISDDDAYPDKNAFDILNKAIEEHKDYNAFCSSVITSEGIDNGHRKIKRNENDLLGTASSDELYNTEHFDINIFSFVGSCINKQVLDTCGLPMKDFFIWFDDTEYSLRVNEKFKMICVPSIRVFHDTIIEKEWRYSWKTYYGERNKLYTLQKHMPKDEFKKYLMHYRFGMMKHFFTDYKYYLSQRDGYTDFKKGITGVPEDHQPGKYKY